MTASQNLARFGYTNVINAQGINQWTLGLMYDDPTFELRGPGHTSEEPVAPFIVGDTLHWLNVPRAAFEIYAFSDANAYNPDDAVASAAVPAMEQDLTGTNAERLWAMTFDLNNLGLTNPENYYIRMRAVPANNAPIRGYATVTYWGAPSRMSAPVDIIPLAFSDVAQAAWYFDAVNYVFAEDIMEGFPDGTFRPNAALTRAEVVTILYRLAGSPDVGALNNPFADVQEGQWWTPQILWAYSEGVTTGFVDTAGVRTFRGAQSVTREEFAAFIARYQEASDKVPMPILMDYEWQDFTQIREFARGYVNLLTMQGVFIDVPGVYFEPQSNASRGMVATVLHRWLTALP